MMEHSPAARTRVFFLKAYLDDSGSDDASTVTTIGGPLMTKDQAMAFDAAWSKLLKRYRIDPPLKMIDFVRPLGRYVGFHPEIKIALLTDICKEINEHKFYSISIEVPQVDFKQLLTPEVCKTVIGPYAFAFFCTVLANRALPEALPSRSLDLAVMLHQLGWRIGYLIDHGCAFPEQLVEAHKIVQQWEGAPNRAHYTGAMAFDTDARISVLQAADVIAWSSRRRALGTLVDEFVPLQMALEQHAIGENGRPRPPVSIEECKFAADSRGRV